jgi:hypothetical protein
LKRRYSFQHFEVEIVALFVYLNSRKFLGMLSTSRLRMKARAQAETITATDAEIACVQGDAATLSQYLRQANEPSPIVIQSIADALLANLPGSDPGPGNLKLEFSRNGRPPKHQPEIMSPAVAIAHGQAIPLGQYLRATPSLDDDTRLALAAAFDPNPGAPSKWQLKYAHARRGFPRSSLRTELQDAWLGTTALSVYEKDGKPWKQVHYEVEAALKLVGEHASPTLIKKCVAKVREARQLPNKKPLD